uniref:Uncharacterized protein n=1 Tax=Rhizophora mucronata TaxID=61149 RepID=A0A2P2PKX4_RHIMU
MIKLVAIPK